jgi:ribosomal protein S18 acetylase RimI-like enzyme
MLLANSILTTKQVFEPASSRGLTAFDSMTTETLTDEHQPEILAFLAGRAVHTVIMAGYIRDNGVVSGFNRGTFHAYRGLQGSLEGVALIGHATLMETRSSAALRAFARVARSSKIHLIMAEQEKLELFWSYYAQAGQRPSVRCYESQLAQGWPKGTGQIVSGLRQATLDDLELVMLIHAEMALAEGGVNPMKTDFLGFQRRCARRIELGRTWVCRDGQHLIFKVDIMADTPQAIYLEGIWVNPRDRGHGHGLRCLTQVGRELLKRTGALCVLVNENNLEAQALYRRAGFTPRGTYQSVFLQSQPQAQTK